MNLLSRVIQYARDIVDGRILACQKHKWACKRFLDDFERLQNDNSPYEFDEMELYQFYKWANMFKHTKGVLAGQPIELTDFQLFIVGNLFCWKDKETGLRRFKKAYIQLARKNAKSQLLALITSYVCFLGDEQEECYIAGWGREQSSIVYNEILSQIRGCELLRGKYKDSYGRITHLRSGSIIQPLSKEARKTGDGKHPSLAVIDEYHAHETSEIYDIMVSGMVGRENPLIVIITTAGLDMSRPCYTEYLYTSKILDPSNPVENDEYFVMICELEPDDDIKDERNWIKANPIVATYEEGMAFLRSELRAALDVPEKMRSFLTKNMNRWVDQKDNGYLALSDWNACGVDALPELTDHICFVGIDLSSSIDLTSVSFEFPLKDGSYAVFNHSFMPEETLKARMKTDKVRYDLWVEQGWITVTPGAVVDYRFIMKYIMDQAKQRGWTIREICYDPWSATMFAQEMEAEGYTVVEIRQGIKTLSAATKSIRELTLQRKIIHDRNPVLAWAISNAVVRQDHNENIMLDKDKSTNRIDPIASLINAHVRAMMYEGGSVYEERGIITF